MVDLNRLNNAVKIAELGSYSAAAMAIPLSQSALSRSIQSLEEEYSLRIFERGRSGARLTSAGVRFMAEAEAILRKVDRADEGLRAITTGQGETISIGLAPMTAAMFLPGFLDHVVNAENSYRLRVIEGANRVLRPLLLDREIEFYVGTVPSDSAGFAASQGLVLRKLPDVPADLLVRIGHPLVGSDLSPELLAQYPVVAGSFVRAGDRLAALDSLGLRRPAVEVDDYDQLGRLAATTDAILIATAALAYLRSDLGLVRLPVDVAEARSGYALISREGAGLSPAAARAANELYRRIAAAPGLA